VMTQVKAKRWHRVQEGALSLPYKTLRIMGPSPSMTNGWVAFDEAGNSCAARAIGFHPRPAGRNRSTGA